MGGLVKGGLLGLLRGAIPDKHAWWYAWVDDWVDQWGWVSKGWVTRIIERGRP